MELDNEIRKQFKSKFEDFRVPVPEDGWELIEKSLDAAKIVPINRFHRVWKIVGSVAAAAVLIFGSLLFLNKPIDNNENYFSEAADSNLQFNNENLVSENNNFLSEKLNPTKDELFVERKKSVNIRSVDQLEPIKVESLFNQQNNNAQGTDTEKSTDGERTEKSTNDIIFEEISINAQDQQILLSHRNFDDDEEGLVVSMGGRGGLSSFYQTVNTPMTLRSLSVVSDKQFLEEAEKLPFQQNKFKDNIAEMEHDQPVSFGITVSKPVIDGLYIETGLVYSYLYSRSKNVNDVSQNRQTQSLHYLGIPLNLNYNLFSLRNLNVYASLGGMIEKDVYGKFREEGESQSIDDTVKAELLVNEKISQRNPQLSVNAGLGLSYPLYKNLKLYGKIGGTYYFDAKNDFKTIYSDSKIVMDLSVGIRYEFK